MKEELEALAIFSELDFFTETFLSYLLFSDKEKYQGQYKDYAISFANQIASRIKKLEKLLQK